MMAIPVAIPGSIGKNHFDQCRTPEKMYPMPKTNASKHTMSPDKTNQNFDEGVPPRLLQKKNHRKKTQCRDETWAFRGANAASSH